MDIAVARPSLAPADVAFVPGWAVPRAAVTDAVEAAYLAGAALNSLDNLVQREPVWAGAWRQRIALAAAASMARLLGYREDEAALRDAWYLRAAGDDPGPAGNLLAAWRRLASRSPSLDIDGLRSLVDLIGLPWSSALATIPDLVEAAAGSTRPAPLLAAAVAADVATLVPNNEALAWWIADLVLAARLRWPLTVPILATQIHAAVLRGDTGRRLRPGGEGGEHGLCLAAAAGAVEACRLAANIARRAGRLEAVAPKLRSKGAAEAIRLLLSDDAVSGALTTPFLSRWATRRLFDRLSTLDAVREFSGRSTFRLYGL